QRPSSERLAKPLPGHRLVGDDEHVAQPGLAHFRASTSSRCRVLAPLNTPCCAPSTPYSYGPPTTCGTSSKLKIGGGDETCHSSAIDRHGLAGALGPRAQLTIML